MSDPIEQIIITEDSILPAGTIDSSGNYNPIPGIVDENGLIPNTRPDPPRVRAQSTGDVKEFAHHVYLLMSVLKPSLIFAHDHPETFVDRAGTTEFSDQTSRDNRTPVFKDTITWKVVRREPGSLSDKPFGPRKQWNPRIMERGTVKQDDDDTLTDIYMKDFDNVVQFDIVSESNKSCDELADWFEDQMVLYQGYFQQMGIPRVLFLKRTMDERLTTLNTRSLQFYVRTHRYYKADIERIRQIILKLLAIVNTEQEAADFETGRLQEELFN